MAHAHDPGHRRRHRLLQALTLGLTALALAAPTQQAAATDPARAQAKEHFATAERHYAAKAFREAIDEYTKAHELLPMPAFIFNIAQCHRGLEQHEQAVEHYERYLREAGNAEDRELVEQLITEEKAALATATAAAAAAAVEAQPPPPAKSELELAATASAPTDPALTATTEPETELYEEWWFWTAVAVAATALAGGTAIAVASRGSGDPTELPRGSAGTLDWRSP